MQDEVWHQETNQDMCHWRMWREELKQMDFLVLRATCRARPGKIFPVTGNRCSLGGFEEMFLKHEGFKRFLNRSTPPPVFNRFLTVEPKLQAKQRPIGLH